MYHSRASDDPAQRWRRFCRKGWRVAWLFAMFWFGALTLLFRVGTAPGPGPRVAPAKVVWLTGEDGPAMDVRALWTPSAFALSSPAGFSHALRRERAGITPPVQIARPEAAFLGQPRSVAAVDLSKVTPSRLAASEMPTRLWTPSRIFPPRVVEREEPHLSFPPGWESRLFSGIDLNYGAWTNVAWSARMEMQFDAKGVPVSMLLAQASGLPELDRRLTRAANGWRLLEPSAPRTGRVAWTCPAGGSGP